MSPQGSVSLLAPMVYTIEDHIHRFAVWTSARAIQRAFTTTSNIETAINISELRNEVIEFSKNSVDYDSWHKNICTELIKAFKRLSIACSFGRAAKLVAIYVKTTVVIRDGGTSEFSKVAHPPLDRILLLNLHKKNKSLQLNKETWTKWDDEKYYSVIQKLRQFNYDYFWKLEADWTPY